MKSTIRIFRAFLLICLPMAAFSQKADAPQTESKTEESSKSKGMRKIAGRNLNIDVKIDQQSLEAQIESAISRSLRDIENELESIQINIEPIEINLEHLNLDRDQPVGPGY
jgi:TolA-binding protein